jgi:hypothetical protein
MVLRTVLVALLVTAASPLTAGEFKPPSAEAEVEVQAVRLHLEERLLLFRIEQATENRRAAELTYEAFRRRIEPPLTPAEASRRLMAEITGRDDTQRLPTRGRSLEPSVALLERLRAVDRVFDSMASAGVGGCCPCSSLLDCDDGVFCNGPEKCGPNITCLPGSPPCNDGDTCTTDTCLEGMQSCQNDPLPVPEEVMSLAVARDDVVPSGAALSWSPANNADAYNVYRGWTPDLGDLSCLASDVLVTSYDDLTAPNGLFLYLVSSVGCRESGIGDDSSGPRPAPPGCP